MSGAIRKYLSKSISAIELPEVYPWHGWLKRTPNELHSIGSIVICLDDTGSIILRLEPSEINYVFLFNTANDEDGINYINFERVKSSPIFYSFYKSRISAFGFSQIKTSVTNIPELSFTEIVVAEKSCDSNALSVNIENIAIFNNLPKIMQEEYTQVEVEIHSISIDLNEITTNDCLSQFIPEVKKYSLLSDKDLMGADESAAHIDSSINIDFTEIVINTIKNSELYYDAPMMSYKNLHIKSVKEFSFSDFRLNGTSHLQIVNPYAEIETGFEKIISTNNLIENSATELDAKTFINSLEPCNELSEQEIDKILSEQNGFVKTGATMLFKNKTALLYCENEGDKELVLVYAIKMLNRIRAARKILFLVDETDSTQVNYFGKKFINGYWNYIFKKHASEMNVSYVGEHLDTVTKENLLNKSIICLNTAALELLISRQTISRNDLNMFDAIIVADLKMNLAHDKFFIDLINGFNFQFRWMVSNNDPQRLLPELSTLNKEREIKVLNPSRVQNENADHQRNEYNYFLDLDDELLSQYDEALETAKDRVGMVLQAGNLLRFQPNVFQLFHQLQQATNFIWDSLNSPKAAMLIKHVQKILETNDRILIYSQFNNHGLARFEKIFADQKIDCIRFDSSDTARQTREKIVLGSEKNNKIIYITNLKPKAIQFNFPDVAHLINFDSWWNPYTRWEVESKLSPRTGGTIFVHNYFYNDTVEGAIAKRIMEYGANGVDPLFNTTHEQFYSIVNEDYWLKLLNLKSPTAVAAGNETYD